MIARRVVLKVNNSEYDILKFNYKFQRDIDAKGRPCSNYYGGEIFVMLESTDNIQLFQQMIHKDMPTVDGTIEVLLGDDEVYIKRIDFKEAYICSYAEQMQSGSGLPMFAVVSISPMRLDFNNNMLRLDRKWPRAKHGWQKLVAEEAKYAAVIESKDKSILEIYWSYGNDRKRLDHKSRHYVDMNLHIITEGYNEGESISILIKRDDSKDIAELKSIIKVTGEVNANGEVFIKNVLKQYKLNIK